ncbi:U3-lycotoxin-Ls1v like protein [Argiope bruennichi]|uniref:U3-lycotoxin-Ls1v like protein n=1 Tax=Argiope bruennichi TaxID=94029 RepID=A0A8T0EK96_ARGBR|nr:U3-lycotoxin-Ls1v like protein [Argiope bruennichi]
MRNVLLGWLIGLVLIACVLSEENDDEMEAVSISQLLGNLEFVESDELRSDDECIPRNRECTNHRHKCCRSKFFKDKCKCFYVEGNDTETEVELCTCQQEWYLGMTEKIYDQASNLFKKWFG